MNFSTGVPGSFATLHDDLDTNHDVMEATRYALRAMAFISVVSVTVTSKIVFSHGSRIRPSYRNLLFSQMVASAIGASIVSFSSPYIMFPYPALLYTGPIHVDYQATSYMFFATVMGLIFPIIVFLFYGFIYNYLFLFQKRHGALGTSRKSLRRATFLATVACISFNSVIAFCALLHNNQHLLRGQILQMDDRLRVDFDKFAIFLFDVHHWTISTFIAEACAVGILAVIVCIVLFISSVLELDRQKERVSAAAHRNQRTLIKLLFTYVLHIVFVVGVPLLIFLLIFYGHIQVLWRYTLLSLMTPLHLLGFSLSITYCLLITPYRQAIKHLAFSVFTLTQSPEKQPDVRRYSMRNLDIPM